MEQNTKANRSPNAGALMGVRILDLTRLLPGPLATMLLADWGADVLKIEDPNAPDEVRFYPPYTQTGQSAYFVALNRSKRSIALNLRDNADKQTFLTLCSQADIIIESFRPGVMQRLGIDYDSIQQIKNDIIFVSITGYGNNSPYSHEAGHDLNYIARSGLLDLCGMEHQSPALPNFQVADTAAGAYMAATACLLALRQREKTGKGEHVQVSMLDALMPLLTLPLIEYHSTGAPPQRGTGVLGGSQPNYNVYKCADDKYVALAALEPKFWSNFCTLVERNDWQAAIIPNMPETKALIDDVAALFATRTQAEWLKLANKSDICLTPVQNIAEATNDKHFEQQGGIWQTHQHPLYGEATGIKNPLQFKNMRLNSGWAAPLLNEDAQNP